MKTTAIDDGEKVHFKYEEDVEDVLNYAHDKRVQEGEFEKMGEFKQIMRVPMSVMLDIKIKYGWDYMQKEHWPMVAKILKGPEYSKFRTTNRQI
ncbi:hypothetical protein [Paraburkholderia unamae]|uniref:BrnA antitoxin of type II toxin-antitoxin system n=1 Tax=Paraburkholderia unamae TaxID=219649 RepID=A0ABX5KJM5_9BURK|nr:hypothetical protein [Paraburkholderia unamae]PVX77170.1 hypothetical protein C7402_115229 [Paraburkholderia unamae]